MPATPDDLFKRLEALDIETTTVSHPPLFTVAESQALRGSLPGGHCKNLFLKDKKGQFWLVVCLEDAAINLKSLDKIIGSARLSFAKADYLMDKLGVEPGAVTPFALINDGSQDVNVVLDAAMLEHDVLNYHPLTNDRTTAIRRNDLIAFIKACGHEPAVVAVEEA